MPEECVACVFGHALSHTLARRQTTTPTTPRRDDAEAENRAHTSEHTHTQHILSLLHSRVRVCACVQCACAWLECNYQTEPLGWFTTRVLCRVCAFDARVFADYSGVVHIPISFMTPAHTSTAAAAFIPHNCTPAGAQAPRGIVQRVADCARYFCRLCRRGADYAVLFLMISGALRARLCTH